MKYSQRKMNTFMKNPCNDSFVCKVCGGLAVPEGAGTRHRNHCPNCLSSLHVDETPGDRAADCNGIMDPIAVWVKRNGEWAILHRCTRCGHIASNRLAADDNPIKLMSIAIRPLASPPFPIDTLLRDPSLTSAESSAKPSAEREGR